MHKLPESLTLDDFRIFYASNPSIRGIIDKELIDNYEDFVRLLNKNIDICIRDIERSRELYKTASEDLITTTIMIGLRRMGYNATHDTKNGGHVDLTIEQDDYLWLGEAKIFNNYKYVLGGVKQLISRYSLGRPNENRGGLLLYIRKDNTKEIMDGWKDYFKLNSNLEQCQLSACELYHLAFESSFIHKASGLTYYLRHIPAMFVFEPDRS